MACRIAVFRQRSDLKADAQCLPEDHDGHDIELAVRDQVRRDESSHPSCLLFADSLSFEIMRRAPERVVRLALLNTTARSDTLEQSEWRRVQIALAQSGPFAEILVAAEARFPALVHSSRANDDELRRILRLMAEDTGAEAYARQQTAMLNRADSRPGLGTIRCPTLVLVGDSDQATPSERSVEIASGIAGAGLVTVRDCGHASTLERPLDVTRALLEWLD